jgi:hypothetical protein
MNEGRIDLRTPRLEREVAHYLATGESDPLGFAFPGDHTLDRLVGYERHLREALIREVEHREHGREQRQLPPAFNPSAWVRRKVEPMITGLFPAAERPVMLGVAERSIVFLTGETVRQAIAETPYLGSAWTIANIYLRSLGALTLGDQASQVVGLSLETKCYVSVEYFADGEPFADYVTHEVAHIFHNCKRATIGLPYTRSREWLLEIAYGKRETFAYACEVYNRILDHAHEKAHRQALLKQYARDPKIPDDTVDPTELLDILDQAVEARNGWKHILARCRGLKQSAHGRDLSYA